MGRALGILSLAALLAAAAPTAFGGWAVVTVEDLPEYLEAGKPTTLSFEIRQHGVTLVNDFSPTVSLEPVKGGLLSRWREGETVRAARGRRDGLYQATLTPSEPGEVTIVIQAAPLRWESKLLPLRVVAAGEDAPALPAHERGRQLFAAKGCATCHAKKDDPAFADWNALAVGPDLTGRSFAEGQLAMKLADAGAYRVPMPNDAEMPRLALADSEIQALVSFLEGGRRSAGRSGGR